MITLALDAENPVMTSAVHETVHRIRETAPEMYQELANFVLDNLSEESTAFNQATREALYGTDNVDALNEEIVADAFGAMLENSKVLEQFATQHRSAAQKIMDALHDLLVKIERALGSKELRLSENQKAAFRDLQGKTQEMETLFAKALEMTQEKASSKNAANEGGEGKFSIKNIAGDSGKQYGIGVYLDSSLLDNLTDTERIRAVKERIRELGGQTFVAYDANGDAVNVRIAEPKETFVNKNGKRVAVNRDLATKNRGSAIKQESVVLADELISAAEYKKSSPAKYPHGWLDDNGKNDWAEWHTFVQSKDHSVWDATLHIATSATGEKFLYDIDPIKIVERRGNSRTTSTTASVPQNGGGVKPKLSLKTDSDYLAAVQSGDTAAAQKMVDETAKTAGYTIHAYHGTARSDRVGTVFRPDRATSGPMAFFTSSKEIAQNYARDKADTSIAYDTEYDDYYTQFRVTKSGESLSVGELWGKLTPAERAKIKEAAPHIRFDEDYDQIIYDPTARHGNGAYDAYELNRNKGNVLNTLVSTWLETGDLYDREADFLDVLKLAGVKDAEYRNPDARNEKVYDTYLKIQQPFDTATVDRAFYNDLSAWLEKTDISQYQKDNAGADMWDKNAVTPERFLERLADDIEAGTSHAWTSIPDYVTAYLQEQGYDGIKDTGGKGGGESHTVWIPFHSEQVKSAEPVVYDDNGEVIPLSKRFNESERDIRYSLKKYPSAEMRDPEIIEPVNRVTDKAKYAYLVNDFRENGYEGRPVVVYETPYGFQALTGSHRILAAQEAGIDIPAVLIDNPEAIERLGAVNSDDELQNVAQELFEEGLLDEATRDILAREEALNDENYDVPYDEQKRYSLKTREVLDEYIAQYGEMPAGETPHRRISVPKRTAENKYVSQTIRTVLEAKATPDALVPTLEDMVAKGDFGCPPFTRPHFSPPAVFLFVLFMPGACQNGKDMLS